MHGKRLRNSALLYLAYPYRSGGGGVERVNGFLRRLQQAAFLNPSTTYHFLIYNEHWQRTILTVECIVLKIWGSDVLPG
jgi:hypothetical protein